MHVSIIYNHHLLQTSSNHIKLAFDFYDYDNNGSIGSVDIQNLMRYISIPEINNAYKLFTQILIKNKIQVTFSKTFVGSIVKKKVPPKKKK